MIPLPNQRKPAHGRESGPGPCLGRQNPSENDENRSRAAGYVASDPEPSLALFAPSQTALPAKLQASMRCANCLPRRASRVSGTSGRARGQWASRTRLTLTVDARSLLSATFAAERVRRGDGSKAMDSNEAAYMEYIY